MADERRARLAEGSVRIGHARSRNKPEKKEERAQAEGAIDLETRTELAKAVRNNQVDSVDGCISTGKEANVYSGGTSTVLKVLRTSSLAYKGRANLVSGDRRFARGFPWHSPKQVARTWALKEFRNLHRLYSRNISCPKPLFLRRHIIGMRLVYPGTQPSDSDSDVSGSEDVDPSIKCDKYSAKSLESSLADEIGDNERDNDESDLFEQAGQNMLEDANQRNCMNAAPLLKNAAAWMDADELNELLFSELLPQVRRMYQRARLVHGDLSEYNLLIADRSLVIIDVAQAVDVDHPLAHELLQRDLAACLHFFAHRGARCPSLRACFAYVVNEHSGVSSDEGMNELRKVAENDSAASNLPHNPEKNHTRGASDAKGWEALKDAVFMRCRVPRSLLDVDGYEVNSEALETFAGAASSATDAATNAAGAGHGNAVYAALAISSIGENATGSRNGKTDHPEAEESSTESDEEIDATIGRSESESQSATVDVSRMTKEEAKEHKRKVKQERRKQRQMKTPKSLKKQKEKRGQRKNQK